MSWTSSLAKKNATLHFKEHCTKIDISLVITFFFSQTNLVFKCTPLIIDILDSFCHSLFTFLATFWFLPLFYGFWVYSMPLRLFHKKNSKDLIMLNVIFVRFSSSKCCYVISYFPWKNLICKRGSAVNGKNNFWPQYLYMPCKSCAVLSMLDTVFGDWLWPQLNRSSTVSICQVTFL